MNITDSKGPHVGVVSLSADRTPTEMRELEAMAAKLLKTARKLPAGRVCHDILEEISEFPCADRGAESDREMSGPGISRERR
jgi:hypothetical protein